MKIFKEVEVPARKEKRVIGVVCDVCKKHYEHALPSGNGINWGDINNYFVVAKTSVSYTTGYSYPEGGSGEIQSVDICPKCFSERVVPFFASIGAPMREEDWGD